MKKRFAVLLTLLMVVGLFSGCLKKDADVAEENVVNGDITEEITAVESEEAVEEPAEEIIEETSLPIKNTMEFFFSSGAGGWGTELYLEKDGSFTGEFHDSNMGETGEGYPNGTCYICEFSGKFADIEKIDDTSYRMTLSELTTEKEVGEEWIENGILYVVSTPYGIEGGSEFMFYTPRAEINSMSEEFLWWWPMRFEEVLPEKLGHYGIHNVNTNDGFFSY